MMSSTSRAWIVAASVGAVEALKDQGFCRWNYAIRSFHQHAKNKLGSIPQVPKKPSSPPAMVARRARAVALREEEKAKQSEESLRKVIYLSCWGPN